LAIDFPTPTQVGQVYTDPTSGNTYVCVVLGPPAEWSGSSDNADLDQTYLRTDASNGPVSGNLGIGGSAAAPNIILGTGGTIAGPNTSVANKYAIDASGTVSLGGSPTTPNMKLESGGEATTRNVLVYGSNSSFTDGLLRSGLDMDLSGSVKYGRLYCGSGSTTAAGGTGLRFLTEPIGGVVPSVCMEISPTGTVGIGSNTAAYSILLNANGTVVTTADATINGLTVGRGAGDVLTNVALGSGTFASNGAGAFNVAIGADAGALIGSNSNVAIGSSALSTLTSGQCNTAVGANAGATFTTGGGNIIIGVMNSLGQTAPVFAGSTQNNIIGMGHTSIASAYVQVAWTVTSDARDKMNFGSVPHGLDFVKQLQPVQYQFKFDRQSDEANGPVRYGFKAQDILALEGADPVIIDADDADKLKYRGESLVPVLVNAIQELSAKIETLESEVATLKGA
jgi:hypothetical protein